MDDFNSMYPEWMKQSLKGIRIYLDQKNKPSIYNNLTISYLRDKDKLFYMTILSHDIIYGLGFNLYESPYRTLQDRRIKRLKAIIKWRLQNIWKCDFNREDGNNA